VKIESATVRIIQNGHRDRQLVHTLHREALVSIDCDRISRLKDHQGRSYATLRVTSDVLNRSSQAVRIAGRS
jgi:hypothetical protein